MTLLAKPQTIHEYARSVARPEDLDHGDRPVPCGAQRP